MARRNTTVDTWDHRHTNTPHGLLRYTVFPGRHGPFIAAPWLNDHPIAVPAAHRILVEVGHPDAGLDYLGRGGPGDR